MIPFPPLPYDEDALRPFISEFIVSYHYNKLTREYYDTLNTLIAGTPFDTAPTLEHILNRKTVYATSPAVFINAAMAWNHMFYWQCLSPKTDSNTISDEFLAEINREFGSEDNFKQALFKRANEHFASGWCWVVMKNGKLSIKVLPNAGTPMMFDNEIPIFVIDLWEHAYYPQYAAERAGYLASVWDILNWNFINDNFKKAI
jgi:Fe-Mn family superoxide dismutase